MKTLDDLSPDDYAKAEKSIKKFHAGRLNASRLYDDLSNLGLNSEYVSEYVDLEVAIANGEV